MSVCIARQFLPRTFCILQNFSKSVRLSADHVISDDSTSKFPSRSYSTGTKETSPLTDFLDEFEVDEAASIYGDLDITAVTNNDKDKLHDLKLLLTKLNIMAQRGVSLPNNVKLEQWQEIMKLPTLTQRIKLIKYLRKREEVKESQKKLKMEKQILYQKFLEQKRLKEKPVYTTSSPPEYGLCRNTIFHRFRDKDIEKFYNYKLLDPYMYGPDIIFDCDYDRFMTKRELSSAAGQIGRAWHVNRENFNPFNIIYCNLSQKSVMYSKLQQSCPPLGVDPAYPFNTTPQNFIELYPKNKLVYLSPHAVNTLQYYDPDKIYIIGAMVDIVMPEPLSLAKAKKYGIEAVRFPFEKYVNWRAGGKSLQMDHCLGIMLDLKKGYDWKTILLKHVPSKKLAENQPEAQKDEDYKKSARRIKRMYLKNKVHELLIQKE